MYRRTILHWSSSHIRIKIREFINPTSLEESTRDLPKRVVGFEGFSEDILQRCAGGTNA